MDSTANGNVHAKYKRYVLILIGALIVGGIIFIASKQSAPSEPKGRTENTTPATVEEMRALPPLPQTDEATLQKQLQDIVAGGKESECASLSDPRYQYACHDFFKVKK